MRELQGFIAILGVLFFITFGMLAVAQIDTLQTTAQAATSDGLNLFFANLSPLVLIIVATLSAATVISTFAFMLRLWSR